jgi:hypothetical protein
LGIALTPQTSEPEDAAAYGLTVSFVTGQMLKRTYATSLNTGTELRLEATMDIADLKDPRDRDHAIRDNRAVSIHQFKTRTQVRSRHQNRTEERQADYDKLADHEFNKGLQQ